MKILLCALNSKFIHSSLSVRCLYSFSVELKDFIEVREFTINQSVDFIVQSIYNESPDILCFSCYIWNIRHIEEICAIMRQVAPGMQIILGGPEVSFPPFDLSAYHADIIAYGEGEETFRELAQFFACGKGSLALIKGIAYQDGGRVIVNPPRPLLDMNTMPFTYETTTDLENKIIYYEASRGCPYQCAYCLSSAIEGVRFIDIEKVYRHLDFFIDGRVKQVKFVDRTFNCQGDRALKIWAYIIERDNGYTNFHFEIGADLLDGRHLDCLSKAREGLIQFEAGVQSTNAHTLKTVCRTTDLDLLYENVKKIKAMGNIHQHLDLIAGLPGENYSSFGKSFDDVFAMRPEMLQLGFLKVLKGSKLSADAENYGLHYREKAPYEVLFNRDISFQEIIRLKAIENILDIYYNSGLFHATMEYALSGASSGFSFFGDFAAYWQQMDYDKISHTKQRHFEVLYEYLAIAFGSEKPKIEEFIKFDMFMNENVKNMPVWIQKTDYRPIMGKIDGFFSNEENAARYFPRLKGLKSRQLSRMCHIEGFSCNILKWLKDGTLIHEVNYCLFVYGEGKTKVYEIKI